MRKKGGEGGEKSQTRLVFGLDGTRDERVLRQGDGRAFDTDLIWSDEIRRFSRLSGSSETCGELHSCRA